MPTTTVRKQISLLLKSQLLAVLSTQSKGQPYASLIAYVHTPDLSQLLFATPRPTRKYTNLIEQPRVSLLIDSRSNSETDFHAAEAVTVIGQAREIAETDKAHHASRYSEKHPYLKDFVNAPTTVLFTVEVKHYILVNRFQHVMELHLTDEVDIFS